MPDSTHSTANQTRGQKAAATRKRNQARKAAAATRSDARRTTTAAKETAGDAQAAAGAETKVRFRQAQQLAERAVLLPVGATLVARDTVVSTVTGVAQRFGTRAGVGRELKRYERRGATARRDLESQVRRTRRSFEREVGHRRSSVEKAVSQNRRRVERGAKSARERIGSIAP